MFFSMCPSSNTAYSSLSLRNRLRSLEFPIAKLYLGKQNKARLVSLKPADQRLVLVFLMLMNYTYMFLANWSRLTCSKGHGLKEQPVEHVNASLPLIMKAVGSLYLDLFRFSEMLSVISKCVFPRATSHGPSDCGDTYFAPALLKFTHRCFTKGPAHCSRRPRVPEGVTFWKHELGGALQPNAGFLTRPDTLNTHVAWRYWRYFWRPLNSNQF